MKGRGKSHTHNICIYNIVYYIIIKLNYIILYYTILYYLLYYILYFVYIYIYIIILLYFYIVSIVIYTLYYDVLCIIRFNYILYCIWAAHDIAAACLATILQCHRNIGGYVISLIASLAAVRSSAPNVCIAAPKLGVAGLLAGSTPEWWTWNQWKILRHM